MLFTGDAAATNRISQASTPLRVVEGAPDGNEVQNFKMNQSIISKIYNILLAQKSIL